MDRRQFMFTGSAAALAAVSPPVSALAGAPASAPPAINFRFDGLGLSPREYTRQLAELAQETQLAADNYSNGGIIGELEKRFAELLGKQAAMYVPTGTLANHLALRSLAGTNRRVLVQADSHIYNDSGDAATLLSGLQLIPLAAGSTTITLDEVKHWVERSAGGRVPADIGVIAIENPVRRHDHRMADHPELERVCRYARERGIRLHLDGARLCNLPQHAGVGVREFAALFDTVFVSLWKHFNAASGAILAGDSALIDGLYNMRRMFGGSLPQAWPAAALAMRYVDAYQDDYAAAWRVMQRCFAGLPRERFELETLDDGTSKLWLTVRGIDAITFVDRLDEQRISLPRPAAGSNRIPLQINTSLAGADPDALRAAFLRASVVA